MTVYFAQSTMFSSGSVPVVTPDAVIFLAFPSAPAVYAPLKTVSKRKWNAKAPAYVPAQKETKNQKQSLGMDKKKTPGVTYVPVKKQSNCQKEIANMNKKKTPGVTLKLYTPNFVSIRQYPIFPSKTDKKAAQSSKNQQESAANAPPSLPLIDTSISPPSFLTPPQSGPTSPTPIIEKPSFAFNLGVVNAPKAGVKVAKKHLLSNGDAFEMYVDHNQPKKLKVFSPEEVKKQSSLVDEWKRKIQESL